MLEILYNTTTLLVLAWNADTHEQGHFTPTPEQAVVIWPIGPPTFDSDWYKVDLINQVIFGNPDYLPFGPDYVRAHDILKNSPPSIPNNEMCELLRIYGRKLGYDF